MVKCVPKYLRLLICIECVVLNLLSLSFILIGGLIHANVVIGFVNGAQCGSSVLSSMFTALANAAM